jgi:hypothetical protein
MKMAGLLLKCGCRVGLSLYDIASLIVRQDLDNEVPSVLERIHHEATERANMTVQRVTSGPFLNPKYKAEETSSNPTPVKVVESVDAARSRFWVKDIKNSGALDTGHPYDSWPDSERNATLKGTTEIRKSSQSKQCTSSVEPQTKEYLENFWECAGGLMQEAAIKQLTIMRQR